MKKLDWIQDGNDVGMYIPVVPKKVYEALGIGIRDAKLDGPDRYKNEPGAFWWWITTGDRDIAGGKTVSFEAAKVEVEVALEKYALEQIKTAKAFAELLGV